MDFHGSNIVITGGASGIGYALAQAFIAEGGNVVIADVREEETAAAARKLAAGGGTALPFVCDVSTRSDVEALATFCIEQFGAVNILCNNAGVGKLGRVEKTRPNDFDWIFAVNVTGVYNGASIFAPHLKATARRGGFAHMLNTASEHALGVPPVGSMPAYTASKHAVLGMSDSMRHDFARDNVGVSVLCPGPVATAVWDCARNRPDRFGGARHAPAEIGEFFKTAQDPTETARITLDGIRNGDFYILPHPRVRGFVTARYEELMQALDDADARAGETNIQTSPAGVA